MKVIALTGTMFIKLITIIFLTYIFIQLEGTESTTVLSTLKSKLDYIVMIFYFVFPLISFFLLYKKFKSKFFNTILKTVVETSFGTAHVAVGFIFALGIHTWIQTGEDNIRLIKQVFGTFTVIWLIIVGSTWILNKMLEEIRDKVVGNINADLKKGLNT